jgi:autotransporter-associated beta strand protein/T5SS/PEP-CTERM-associated repeat protein
MNMVVGLDGAGNSLVISDGATVRSFIGQLGYNAGSSNNSALVTGSGSVWNNTNSYYGIQVGMSGGATLTVANGGTVNLNGTTLGLSLAENAGSTGTLNIGRFGTNDAAGTVSTPKIAFGAGTGTINFNQSNSTTISAAISGNGSVNQLGSGTTILTGNNTYTGSTTVENGTLLVDGEISLSDVSVLAGATIGGSGVLGGRLTLEAGAQFVFSLGGALTVNGASVTFGDFGIDDLVGLDGTVANGAYTIIDGAATIDIAGLANLGEGNAYDIGGGKQAYFSTGSLVVNVVPEPSTYALLGLSALALGAHVLRRHRK